MKLKEMVVEILGENKKAMHVSEIASCLVQKWPNIPLEPEKLVSKVNALLSVEAKKPRSQSLVTKPKNKTGGYRKGYYRLRMGSRTISKSFKVPEQPKVSSQFTGKAGEFAVMSELLFFGFNVSSMTVDDGIDVVASKAESYFHIQVKTANVTAKDKFQFKITRRAFGSKDAAGTFYVLVLRLCESSGNTCEYLIFPSSEIRRLVDIGVLKGGDSIGLTIDRERGNRFVLNGVQEVTWALNRFDNIK